MEESNEAILTQNTSKNEEDREDRPVDVQPKSQVPQEEAFPVMLDGEILFTVLSARGISAQERAEQISQLIETIAQDWEIPVDSLQMLSLTESQALYAQADNAAPISIILLQQSDAEFADQSLNELAEKYLIILKDAISQYRQSRSVKNRSLAILYTAISTVVLLAFLIIQNKLFPIIYGQIRILENTRFRAIRWQNFQLISPRELANFCLRLIRLLRWGIILLAFYLYFVWILGFFPATRQWADQEAEIIFNELKNIGQALIGYRDELIVIVITILISYYIIRLFKRFFDAIAVGRLSLPGFYREWAQPTYKLVVLLIIALAGAIIFPYLPGADSPSFQGISIFVGALVTFGSAGAISNLVGGIILIYTRAFEIGDRIEIGEVMGDVMEKTILSTRICTVDNEIITIPNFSIISTNIKNYSATIRDFERPLILQTTITLGYDIPWRKVQKVLIEAAQSTSDILDDPLPFVWPVSLDDFYVSYQLKAYTSNPSKLGEIYAHLHQNILDKCNEAGIEIMSPHYSAIRDGNQNTIPAEYLPEDYISPTFRLESPEIWYEQKPRQSREDRP
jgi:small-conductance mechanosensitive channel